MVFGVEPRVLLAVDLAQHRRGGLRVRHQLLVGGVDLGAGGRASCAACAHMEEYTIENLENKFGESNSKVRILY